MRAAVRGLELGLGLGLELALGLGLELELELGLRLELSLEQGLAFAKNWYLHKKKVITCIKSVVQRSPNTSTNFL